MIEIAKIGDCAALRLCDIAKKLKSIAPSSESYTLPFEFDELAGACPNDLKQIMVKETGTKCLSVYSMHLNEKTERREFLDLFESAKSCGLGNLAYPRLNAGLEDLSQDFLYVGTSRNTANRLMQHLGFGPDRTYALHLAKWATSLTGGITLQIHPFKLAHDDQALLPYLEDALAESLKPLLGRRGNL